MRNVIANEVNEEEFLSKSKIKASSDSDQSETEEESSKETIMYQNINLLKTIAETLNSIIEESNKSKKKQKDHSPFVHEHAPKISLFDYLLRIQKYSEVEDSTLIMALIYIDRICKKKGIALSKYNIHRLLFTSILIAIKYNEDTICDNLYYSKIAGVTKKELQVLEYEFMKIIDFDLFVSNKIYQTYYDFLNCK
jgi:hypothetical protein